MRTLGALATHVAGYSHKLAWMLRFDLKDGTSIGLTDHNNDLDFNLGDGSLTYQCNPGVNISDVTLAAGFDTSNTEASGPILAPFTRPAVLGGRFRGAVARLFMVNWSSLSGYAAMFRGTVGECRIEGNRWYIELRNAADAFNQTQGGVLTPYCRTYFGSPKCGVTRPSVSTTVTAVASAAVFTVDLAGSHADDYFNYGNAAFTSGELAGTDEARILDYMGTGATVELFEPLYQPPEVGDAVTLYRGCSKLLKSDDASVPTCLSWSNVVNFRGHPEVPGSRNYHKVSAPGRTMSRGAQALVSAREWIGTPVKWEQSAKGLGCDCRGLLAGICRENGWPEGNSLWGTMVGYSRRIDERVFLEGLDRLFDRRDGEPQEGDILAFRIKYRAQHLAIATGTGRMVHAYQTSPSQVIEQDIGVFWGNRLAGVWQWR